MYGDTRGNVGFRNTFLDTLLTPHKWYKVTIVDIIIVPKSSSSSYPVPMSTFTNTTSLIVDFVDPIRMGNGSSTYNWITFNTSGLSSTTPSNFTFTTPQNIAMDSQTLYQGTEGAWLANVMVYLVGSDGLPSPWIQYYTFNFIISFMLL